MLIAVASAQSRPPALSRADYGQFESISPGAARGGLSPDGRWLAYVVNRANRTSELRFIRLADDTAKTVAQGSQATFSDDGRWVAYSIGFSEAEQDRMRRDRRPIQNKLGLMDLSSGAMATVDGIQSFSFSSNGAYIAMRRYAPQPVGGPTAGTPPAGPPAAAAPEPADPVGATVIVRDLATGRDTTFGNVGEFAWQDGAERQLLAMAINADGRTGNGVHVFDPGTTVLRVLESATASFTGLTWREKQSDLVVLKSKTDERREGPTYAAIAWQGLGSRSERRIEFDPMSSAHVPAGMRTVSFRRPSWSEDGRMVFLGLAPWSEKPPTPAGGRRGGGGGAGPADPTAPSGRPARGSDEVDEPAAVDIWHWKDVDVLSRQKIAAAADRRRNLLAVWHLAPNTLVPIGKSFTESITPVPGTTTAYVEDWTAYAMDRSIGRPAADLFLVDLTTGTRAKLRDRVDDRYAQLSPGGRFVLFLQNDQYWTIDLGSRQVRNVTTAAATSFVDRESDATVKQKPPFGVGGWTKDDAAVLLYDAFDIWRIAPDGSRAARLTQGAADQVRHRLVRLDPTQDWIDLQAPLPVSLFGLWSKKSGYGVLSPTASSAVVDRVVWLDKSVGSLGKAKNADVVSYVVQGHDDSPDVFVSGVDLRTGRQVSRTNPFQTKYAWSRSEIVEYMADAPAGSRSRGSTPRRLQGALYYPAGYDPGRRYPMIVYVYERLSDGVHRYVPPSDRDYYNTTVFTSQGYFVLQPDIVFRPRDPGLSVVECVTPAVKRVVDLGLVDPARVGIIGHSWGGFDTAYLATHTKVFAAGVAGAAITNLVSNYGNHHWSSGIAETDHIETGQQRMEVPLWEDFDAYVRNSAVFNVHNMTTPLLLMTGDTDGTVYWHQSVELYNIARRAKKNVVMLVYNGEDHGLRQKKNQVDYQRRILEFFGHYLKGERAAAWVVDGQRFLDRDAELKRQSGGRYP